MTEEYPEKIIECINKHFPEGDKRRGDALVLQAVAFLEGKELRLKEISKAIDENRKEIEYVACYGTDVDLTGVELTKFQNIFVELYEKKLKQKLGIK